MGGGAGGGGIISIVYKYSADFAGSITAYGGKGISSAAPGTVYLEEKFIHSKVILYNYLFYNESNIFIIYILRK